MLNFDFIFISSHDISSVKNYSNNKLYLYIVLINMIIIICFIFISIMKKHYIFIKMVFLFIKSFYIDLLKIYL